jgi:hypothetical protein
VGHATRTRNEKYIENYKKEPTTEETIWETRREWEDNIKTDPKEVECNGVDRIHLAQDGVKSSGSIKASHLFSGLMV